MADPRIEHVVGYVWQGAIGYANAKPGDLVYYDLVSDNNEWEQATSVPGIGVTGMPYNASKYAQAIVVASGANVSDACYLCRECYIVDVDTGPFNEGGQKIYLSTSGNYSQTRSTTSADLHQVVGVTVDAPNFGASLNAAKTQLAHMKLSGPYEQTQYFPFVHIKTGGGIDSDNDFTGFGLLAANDEITLSFQVPDNAIDIEFVRLWWTGTGVALDTGDTITIDTTGCKDDDTTSQSGQTDQLATQALTVAANDVAALDITAALDDPQAIEPSNIVGLVVLKAAEGAGGDDPIMLGVAVVFTCV